MGSCFAKEESNVPVINSTLNTESPQPKKEISFPTWNRHRHPCTSWILHGLSKYNGKIYIAMSIDMKNSIIEFDPVTHAFVEKLDINLDQHEAIGAFSSVVTVGDHIHMIASIQGYYNGSANAQKTAFIYSPINNTIHRIKEKEYRNRISCACVLRYKNKLVRFGEDGFGLNSVVEQGSIGLNLINGYIHVYIEKMSPIPSDIVHLLHEFYCDKHEYIWSEMNNWKLPRPMMNFGYVIYNEFIISLGGMLRSREYSDNIYVLNLNNKEKGWIESNIKCPHKGQFRAILADNEFVHLFNYGRSSRWGRYGRQSGHHSIHISAILSSHTQQARAYIPC